jgi:hypothetical protein
MPEVFFFPDLLYQRVEYYVEAPKYYITKVEYYTRAIMGKFYFFFHGNVNQLYSFSNCQYASYLLLHINVQIMLSSNLWLHAAVRVVTLMSGSITCADFSWLWRVSTTTYSTTGYYTEAPKCYTTKARGYYTTVYVAPGYYVENPKCFSFPNFTTFTTPPPY